MDSHPLGWRGSSWKAWQHPDLRLPLEPTQTSRAVPSGVCPARERRTALAMPQGPGCVCWCLDITGGGFGLGPQTCLGIARKTSGAWMLRIVYPACLQPHPRCAPMCMPRVLCPRYWVTKPVLVPQGLSVSLGVIRPGPGPCTKEPLIRWAVWLAPYLFAWEPQGGCWEPWNPGGQSLHTATTEACTRVIKSQNSSATRALLDNSQTS